MIISHVTGARALYMSLHGFFYTCQTFAYTILYHMTVIVACTAQFTQPYVRHPAQPSAVSTDCSR